MIYINPMNIKKSRLVFFSLLICAQLTATSSIAQSIVKQSTSETIAIAFFKTANTRPDFDSWARGSDAYDTAPPARANEYLGKEKQRLQSAFNNYDPATDFLNVQTIVDIEAEQSTDANGKAIYMLYIMRDAGGINYFPFEYRDYKIALLPQKIEMMMAQRIPKEQYELIASQIGGKKGEARLSMELKPVKSYLDRPYEMDGTEQWMFLCDIAAISLHSNNKNATTLWTYGADWYISPVKQELNTLYKSPEAVIAPKRPAP